VALGDALGEVVGKTGEALGDALGATVVGAWVGDAVVGVAEGDWVSSVRPHCSHSAHAWEAVRPLLGVSGGQLSSCPSGQSMCLSSLQNG